MGLSAGIASAADGLTPPAGADVWPQWKARLAVNAESSLPVSLVGDYYFAARPLGISGFRATSGVLSGTRGLAPASAYQFGATQRLGLSGRPGGSALWGEPSTEGSALPYVGLGFSGTLPKTGFSLTADLGLVAQGGAAGRGVFGYQGLDLAFRELRLSPILQLGVSYAF